MTLKVNISFFRRFLNVDIFIDVHIEVQDASGTSEPELVFSFADQRVKAQKEWVGVELSGIAEIQAGGKIIAKVVKGDCKKFLF